MPTRRVARCNQPATIHGLNKRHRSLQGLTALPQPLLEVILVSGTDTDDMKALRLTCKIFQQLLNDNCVCVKLCTRFQQFDNPTKFISRMQHWRSLRAAILDVHYDYFSSFLRLLPDKITTLTIDGSGCPNVKGLDCDRLRSLTTLNLTSYGSVEGLKNIYGLTSLNTQASVGCLAHLAPTLKQLRVRQLANVVSLNQLTNLEVLEVQGSMPADFFRNHGKLPLQHLSINAKVSANFYEDPRLWEMAPTTLTRLSVNFPRATFPSALPASITHLQLLYLEESIIDSVAAALPGLKSLDIHSPCQRSVTRHLSRLTNLQSLCVCRAIPYYGIQPMTRKRALSLLSGVATAVKRGVELTVVTNQNELLGELDKLHSLKSVWATHY